jgi:hypothetical protein
MSWSRVIAAALVALSLHCSETQAQTPLGILLAAGDIAKCAHQNDEKVAAVIAKQVLDADEKNIPVYVLALGDLAYDHGSTNDFKCFDASWGSLLRLKLKNSDVSRLMLPVPGNHEYEPTGGMPFYDYFDKTKNPWVFQQEPDGKKQKSNNKGYYTLRVPDPKTGPWQLFGLNSELRDNAKTAQLNWLERELKASDPEHDPKRPPCVLAFWHRPVFSSGMHGHGDCDKVKGKPCKAKGADLCRPDKDEPSYCGAMKKMKPAYELLHAEGASVILAGHDHHFEQFKRLTANAKPDATRGIRSFIVGTGGGTLYQETRTHRWEPEARDVYSHSSFGVLRIELFADHYRWQFLQIDGDPEISLRVDGVTIDNDVCIARP